MDRESTMEKPLNDFDLHSPPAHAICKKLAHKLLKPPRVFSKICIDWIKTQQCKQKPDESIPEYYERFKKTFKQYSGMTPESFSKHQNDPLLTSTFLEAIDEELATLLKDTIYVGPHYTN